MSFTLEIDDFGRGPAKVAALLRSVAERVESCEAEGEISDGDETCGEFSLVEDQIGEAGGEDPNG